jgi:hypothetical protein
MRLLAAALIALIPTAAGAVAAPDGSRPKQLLFGSPNCPRTTHYYAWQRGKSVKPHKLTELPPANAYLAVLRVVGGCEEPVVVRYRIGG